MIFPIKRGDTGKPVRKLQTLLVNRDLSLVVDGQFGLKTYNAVRAFQAQNLDQNGNPLVVDGKVGPLTWWSLNNPKPQIVTPAAVDFTVEPPLEAGGSVAGRAALRAAIGELRAKAGEIGGNNRGKFVKKYLEPAGLPEGNSWCASFVSWCYLQAAGGSIGKMKFKYTAGSRDLLRQIKQNGWAKDPVSGYEPLPGDVVIWWRVSADAWQGHVGLVYQLKDGYLYTIEGNKSPKVQGFSYVFSRMERLLGYGTVV